MIIHEPIALPGDKVTIVKPRSRNGALVEGTVASATYWAEKGGGRWTYGVSYLAGNGQWLTARILSNDCIRRGGKTDAEKAVKP